MGLPHSPLVCGTYHNEGEGYFKLRNNPNGSRFDRWSSTARTTCVRPRRYSKLTAFRATLVNSCNSGNASFPAVHRDSVRGGVSKGAKCVVRMGTRWFKGQWDPSITGSRVYRSARSPAAATAAEVLAHEEGLRQIDRGKGGAWPYPPPSDLRHTSRRASPCSSRSVVAQPSFSRRSEHGSISLRRHYEQREYRSIDVRNDTLSGGALGAVDLRPNSVRGSEVQDGSLTP